MRRGTGLNELPEPGGGELTPPTWLVERLGTLEAERTELLARRVAELLAERFQERKNPTEPETLSGAEMARRLGVGRTTLHRLRKRGCPALRLGDSYRFRPTAVLAWLAEQEDRHVA